MPHNKQPNMVVLTPVAGDSSNKIANTQFVATAISNAIGSANITTNLATKAGTTQTDFISGGISVPQSINYFLIDYIPFTATFNSISIRSLTGNMTAQLFVNSTAISGVLAVGTSALVTTMLATSVGLPGQTLFMASTNNSSARNISFSIIFTRTLATT